MNRLYLLATLVLFTACGTPDAGSDARPEKEEPDSFVPQSFFFGITELSDEQYPDNPDIGFRSEDYRNDLFKDAQLDMIAPDLARLAFFTEAGDSVVFPQFSLKEYIPTVPERIRDDAGLTRISLINQEWNRNQVRFAPSAYETNIPGIVRVDVARNCLNACLWEVALYVEEQGKETPWAHGWFTFPHPIYINAVEAHNAIQFDDYKDALYGWQDPGRLPVDLNKLRTVTDTLGVRITDLSDAMYPLGGAREKKFKEIVTPESFETMRDLQTDATTFATFVPPGYYSRAEPRPTELGRFVSLTGAEAYHTDAGTGTQTEYQLRFSDGTRETTLVFGGMTPTSYPTLPVEQANKGFRTSMGIGNHPFYETAEEHEAMRASENPYFGLLLDDQGRWLDSHTVGIDGPLIHRDMDRANALHIWLLSFERHALVGHYLLEFDRPIH